MHIGPVLDLAKEDCHDYDYDYTATSTRCMFLGITICMYVRVLPFAAGSSIIV